MSTRSVRVALVAAQIFISSLALAGCGLWQAPPTPSPSGTPADQVVSDAKDLDDAVQKLDGDVKPDGSCNGYQLTSDNVRHAIDNNWSDIPADFQPYFRELENGTFDPTTMSLASFDHCQFVMIIVTLPTPNVQGTQLSYKLTVGNS